MGRTNSHDPRYDRRIIFYFWHFFFNRGPESLARATDPLFLLRSSSLVLPGLFLLFRGDMNPQSNIVGHACAKHIAKRMFLSEVQSDSCEWLKSIGEKGGRISNWHLAYRAVFGGGYTFFWTHVRS